MIKKVYLTLCFSLVSLFVVFHSYILPLINSVKKKNELSRDGRKKDRRIKLF